MRRGSAHEQQSAGGGEAQGGEAQGGEAQGGEAQGGELQGQGTQTQTQPTETPTQSRDGGRDSRAGPATSGASRLTRSSTPKAMNDMAQKASRKPRPPGPRTRGHHWFHRDYHLLDHHLIDHCLGAGTNPFHAVRGCPGKHADDRCDADDHGDPDERRDDCHRSKAARQTAFPPPPDTVPGTPVARATTPGRGAPGGVARAA